MIVFESDEEKDHFVVQILIIIKIKESFQAKKKAEK